jgi:hypothetical protein
MGERKWMRVWILRRGIRREHEIVVCVHCTILELTSDISSTRILLVWLQYLPQQEHSHWSLFILQAQVCSEVPHS